jgi:hypothetical protein
MVTVSSLPALQGVGGSGIGGIDSLGTTMPQ